MQITLCLDAQYWQSDTTSKPKALATLLSRADRLPAWPKDETIYSFFLGLKQNKKTSIAALHAAAWDVSAVTPIWMHADPVHIVADQNNAFLVDRVAPTDDEITSLLLEINQHLTHDDCALLAPRAEQWLLNIPNKPDISTIPVTEVIGHAIAEKLPDGVDHVHWRRLFTELQILLYRHPVNEARRARNMPTVDALWFWGEGDVPEVLENAVIYSLD
ncbi:MAG: hypothetical protein ACK4PR_12750, partial [Gammaproteobacteria bacterium]